MSLLFNVIGAVRLVLVISPNTSACEWCQNKARLSSGFELKLGLNLRMLLKHRNSTEFYKLALTLTAIITFH